MYQVYQKQDEMKRKLRELKKLEMKIRPGVTKGLPGKNKELVWDKFFDLKEEGKQNVKYPIHRLISLTKDEFKDVVNEYFYHVYYWFCQEFGITGTSSADIETLTRLGLPIDADSDEIRRRFRELAKIYHPDNGGDSDKFIEIMEKYKNCRTEERP